MSAWPNAPRRRCAGQAFGPEQQDDDEDHEYRDRSEDAADKEVGRLLEEAQGQAADHGTAVGTHAAQGDRHEAVEIQDRLVAEEGQQHLRTGEARQRADHAGQRVARHPERRFRQA